MHPDDADVVDDVLIGNDETARIDDDPGAHAVDLADGVGRAERGVFGPEAFAAMNADNGRLRVLYRLDDRRDERPDPRAGFGALFRSPLSIMLLVIVYLANLYAAFEISIFKNYPAAAVCSAAAVVPILGPAVFLCLPRRLPGVKQEPEPEQLAEEHQAQHVVTHEHEVAEAPAPAPVAHAGPALPPPTIYQRGHFSFNRRFFETKMPGFLRVVPSEAEKDMLIFVKSSRGEHVATRISRLTPNEIYLHVVKGGASAEVMIPYTELAEIQVRHKDLA